MTFTPWRTMPPPICLAATVACLGLLLAGCQFGPIGYSGSEDAFIFVPQEDDPADDDDTVDDASTLEEPMRGYVQDPLGLRLPDVHVFAGGEHVADSDGAGRFEVPDVADGATVIMTFIKDGYATTWGSFVPTEHGHNFFSQTMAPVDLQTEFPSWQDTEFEIDGSHWFGLPADTVIDEDGEVYDGVVSLSATVWDIGTSIDEGGEYVAAPGDGQGVDMGGEDQLLYTYGMFQIEMIGEQGEALQAGEGVLVQVEVPNGSNVEDGDQVPFWDFDDQIGEWVEQDQGTIVELDGGGQVWEYEPTQGLPVRTTTTDMVTQMVQASCNPDDVAIQVPVEQTGTATGQVTNAQGQPIQGAQVRIIAEDQTYMVPTQTNSDGWFSATVPPVVQNPVGPNGRPLFVEVDYEAAEQPFLWRQDPIAPPTPGSTVSFGQVDTGSMTCVQGAVLDLAGQPVADVHVAGARGGNAVTEADGSFCLQVPKWQPSSVYALPSPDGGVGYQPVRVRPSPGSASNCGSCPNVVELRAYVATACASGELWIGGEPADGLRIEAFDARFPSAPVFATVVEDGEYTMTIPAGTAVTLRVGAGDLHESNECASQLIPSQPAGNFCVDLDPMVCDQ